MNAINTALHHYCFDTSKPDQSGAYDKLRADVLDNIGFPVWEMRIFGDYSVDSATHKFMDKVRASVGPVALETTHLFDNQWNSSGLRLFNWAECRYPNKKIREGYYLKQTDEMREVLRNTHKCGYCGNQEPADSGHAFCPRCIDSEYLTADDLRLTRMVPVRDTNKPRAELSDAERAHLIPLFNAAQVHGATERGKARIAKARARVQSEYEKTISDAKEKRDAAVWLMDNAPEMLENWIFYRHTGRHSFGWRKKLSEGEVSALLDVISEFPFVYTIECADGRKLENYA